MKRRDFFRVGALALLASQLKGSLAHAAGKSSHEPYLWACEGAVAGPDDLSVRFLGTGAAGWKPGKPTRRNSSVLLDGKVLIDLTVSHADMLPEGCRPEVIFYTHTHGDHFQPLEALKVGVKQVYISSTVADVAAEQFARAAAELGVEAPAVHPLELGQSVEVEGLKFTALPANHMTGFWQEQAQIYLIEKGTTEEKLGVRLLYATDTAGIMGRAARIVGIDPHIKPGRPITGLIMEATQASDKDFRIFVHSSTVTVQRTAEMLLENERLLLPEDQPVYMTHMAKSLHPSQEEMDRTLPSPLRAAFDGLETVFRAQ